MIKYKVHRIICSCYLA